MKEECEDEVIAAEATVVATNSAAPMYPQAKSEQMSTMVDGTCDPDAKIGSVEPIAYATDNSDQPLPAMGIPLVERYDFGTNENGFKRTFPEKLMQILSLPETQDAMQWVPDGEAFIIKSVVKCVNDILPRFFKQTKFASFVRKLNRWGFKQISKGTRNIIYHHQLFKRGQLELCMTMRCSSHGGSTIKANAAASKQGANVIRGAKGDPNMMMPGNGSNGPDNVMRNNVNPYSARDMFNPYGQPQPMDQSGINPHHQQMFGMQQSPQQVFLPSQIPGQPPQVAYIMPSAMGGHYGNPGMYFQPGAFPSNVYSSGRDQNQQTPQQGQHQHMQGNGQQPNGNFDQQGRPHGMNTHQNSTTVPQQDQQQQPQTPQPQQIDTNDGGNPQPVPAEAYFSQGGNPNMVDPNSQTQGI